MADRRAQSRSQHIIWAIKGCPRGRDVFNPFLRPLLFFFLDSSSSAAMVMMKCDASLRVILSWCVRRLLHLRLEGPSERKSIVRRGGGCRTTALGGSPTPQLQPTAQVTVDPLSHAASTDAFLAPGSVEPLSRYVSLERGRILAI
jgi:hypothetical protein